VAQKNTLITQALNLHLNLLVKHNKDRKEVHDITTAGKACANAS